MKFKKELILPFLNTTKISTHTVLKNEFKKNFAEKIHSQWHCINNKNIFCNIDVEKYKKKLALKAPNYTDTIEHTISISTKDAGHVRCIESLSIKTGHVCVWNLKKNSTKRMIWEKSYHNFFLLKDLIVFINVWVSTKFFFISLYCIVF